MPERPAPSPAPLPSVAHQARTAIARGAAPLLREALRLADETITEPALTGQIWSAAGVAWGIEESLREAQRVSGRRIAETVLLLHRGLLKPSDSGSPTDSSKTSESTPAAPLPSPLQHYTAWLAAAARAGSPWLSVLIAWIDILSERLTMHRYSDARHRPRQARALLAAPVRLMQTEPLDEGRSAALDQFCARLLEFWDLWHAERQSEQGWNRVAGAGSEPGSDTRIGGFYGLGDSACAPRSGEIRQSAESLATALDAGPPLAIHPLLDPWLARLGETMRSGLARYLADGRWPEFPDRPSGGWRRFFKRNG